MTNIQKTSLGLLSASLVGTVAFFLLLVTNIQLDRGNEWFRYERAIIAVTSFALLGTLAFVGWKQPHGKKIALGGLFVLLAYFLLFFASGTSLKSSGNESIRPSNKAPEATR